MVYDWSNSESALSGVESGPIKAAAGRSTSLNRTLEVLKARPSAAGSLPWRASLNRILVVLKGRLRKAGYANGGHSESDFEVLKDGLARTNAADIRSSESDFEVLKGAVA